MYIGTLVLVLYIGGQYWDDHDGGDDGDDGGDDSDKHDGGGGRMKMAG